MVRHYSHALPLQGKTAGAAFGVLLSACVACADAGTVGDPGAPYELGSAAPGAPLPSAAVPPPELDPVGKSAPTGSSGRAGAPSSSAVDDGSATGLGGAGSIDSTPDDLTAADAGAGDAGGAGPAHGRRDAGGAEPGPGSGDPDPSVAGDAGLGADAGGAGADRSDFVLAVLGSSTAAGDGAGSEASAWVARLETTLQSRVAGTFDVYNFATGGLISLDLLPGSGHPGNIDAALAEQPDLIVVALAGSNDLSAGTSTTELLARLSLLRDTAFEAGVPLFFLSTAPKDLSDSEREQLAAWASSMAASFQACPVPDSSVLHSPCFIDVFAPLADATLGLAEAFDSGDGIHINDAGHAVIYELTRAVLEPYVCSQTRCR